MNNEPELKVGKERHDLNFKRNAVEPWLGSGKSAEAVAGELGISGQTLKVWKQQLAVPVPASQRPTMEQLLEENRLDKLAAAIETSADDGMITFNQSLFNLVKSGRVSEKEALAKASNPQALEMNFKGIFLNEGGRIVS